MKNSSRYNPTKDVAAPSTQKQRWPANRAETFTRSRLKPGLGAMLRHSELPVAASHPGIRASRHIVTKPATSIPLWVTPGDNDIINQQEKTL